MQARKGLLTSTEAPAPLLFSGVFAVVVVSVVIAIVSFHASTAPRSPEPWTATEWGGIGLSYVLLWTVLSLSSFIRYVRRTCAGSLRRDGARRWLP